MQALSRTCLRQFHGGNPLLSPQNVLASAISRTRAIHFAGTVRRPGLLLPKRISKPPERFIRTFARDFRERFRQSPINMTIFVAGLLCALWGGFYTLRLEQVVAKSAWKDVPRDAMLTIMKAISLDYEGHHEKAVRNFREARKLTIDAGRDPLSNEVLTIGFCICDVLARSGRYQDSFNAWRSILTSIEERLAAHESQDLASPNRRRLLAIAISVEAQMAKIAGDSLGNSNLAEKHLTHAVESALTEEARQAQEPSFDLPGQSESELTEQTAQYQSKMLQSAQSGRWLNKSEIASLLNELGQHFTKTSNYKLATPLFLKAVTLMPPDSCETVMLMFSISSCLAQVWPDSKEPGAPSRAQMIMNARQWAEKSLYVASEIQPPQRNRNCDLACIFSTHNLGELAEMESRRDEAEQRYREARSLAQALNQTDAEKRANEGLARLGDRW